MIYYEKVNKMIAEGAITEAIECLKNIISKNPNDNAFYLLGNAYRKKGQYKDALNNYLEAISLNPDSPATEAHAMLVDILEFYHKDYYNP